MMAGEIKNPRRVLPPAFNSTIYRIIFFYLTGALCVGIVSASDDAALLGAIAAGAPGAAKSPYIICTSSSPSAISLICQRFVSMTWCSHEPTPNPNLAIHHQRPYSRLDLLHHQLFRLYRLSSHVRYVPKGPSTENSRQDKPTRSPLGFSVVCIGYRLSLLSLPVIYRCQVP